MLWQEIISPKQVYVIPFLFITYISTINFFPLFPGTFFAMHILGHPSQTEEVEEKSVGVGGTQIRQCQGHARREFGQRG